MKNIFYLIVLLGAFFTGCMPSPFLDGLQYYDDHTEWLEEDSELISSWFHYTVEKKDETYIYKQYYVPENQLTHQYTLKSKTSTIKNGPASEWFDNGQKRYEGFYNENKKAGLWKYYSYFTGHLFSYGEFYNDKRTGVWTNVDSTGEKTATFTYRDGKKHGEFVLYTDYGRIYKKGRYEHGELKSEETLIDGYRHSLQEVDEPPVLINCLGSLPEKTNRLCKDGKLMKAANTLIEYPATERRLGVQGEAIIYFIINEEGTIENFTIARGISYGISEQLKKIEGMQPKWAPITVEGEPVRMRYSIPINFRLY